jgi:hypothetical protein
MKIINNKKKNIFEFHKKIISFTIMLLFFISGIFVNQNFYKLKVFLGDNLDYLGRTIHTNFFLKEKIKIDINLNNYKKLINAREKAIKQNMLLDKDNPWTKTQILFDNQKFKAEIKLRGSHPSNWENINQLGFKLKLSKDEVFKGFSEFSLQHPAQREYIGEYLFMIALKNADLIYSRSDFYDLLINGNHFGLYYLQESISKELLENNKKKVSVVLGFNKEAHLEKYSNYSRVNENFNDIQLKDGFLIANIDFVKLPENFNSNNNELLRDAITLIENFRNSKLKTSEVFDVDKLAKLMAIKVAFGSGEFDWRDLKLYYNPYNFKFEPIGKEVGAGLLEENQWWTSTPWEMKNKKNDTSQDIFLSRIFSDEIFFEKYIDQLNYLVANKEKFLENLSNDEDYFKNLKKLKINFPRRYKQFSLQTISQNIEILKEYLNTNNFVEINLEEIDQDGFKFTVINSLRFPLEIVGIQFYGIQFSLKDKIKISSRLQSNNPQKILIDIKNNNILENINELDLLKEKINNTSKIQSNIKILYKAEYSSKIHKTNVLKLKSENKEFLAFKKKLIQPLILKNDIFKVIDNNIIFHSGDIYVSENIIIPKNFLLKINEGTNIYLEKDSSIISFSPIEINGTKNNPVKIEHIGSNINENYLLIVDANKTSTIDYLFTKNLSAPKDTSQIISGAINFYNSDVYIKNSVFENNFFGDDHMNIISSNFIIEDVQFLNSHLDAIDLDFSNGKIFKALIKNSGNDSFDFSASQASIEKIFISGSGDKAISVGEKSNIKLKDATIENSKFAFVSKDNSILNVNNAVVNNVNFIGAAYQKKREYGPGILFINKINYSNILESNFLRQPNSEIYFDNVLVDENKEAPYYLF